MNWTEERLQWYLKAGERSDYPRVFTDRIKSFLKKEDIILDIGSGPGLFTKELVGCVKTIYNLEPAPLPRKYLEKMARNCDKIKVIAGSWPEDLPEVTFDIAISSFSGARVMVNTDSLEKILEKTRRHIFLIAPAGPKDFGARLEKATSPLPYQKTEASLKKIGFSFQVELISFDFGQPVKDMEEATAFLTQQLKISPQMARNHASRIAVPDGEGLYLPNNRCSALIRIDKL